MIYLAAWYIVAAIGYAALGTETRGLSLEELNPMPDAPSSARATAPVARVAKS
jgi:hypothetical protein